MGEKSPRTGKCSLMPLQSQQNKCAVLSRRCSGIISPALFDTAIVTDLRPPFFEKNVANWDRYAKFFINLSLLTKLTMLNSSKRDKKIF